MSRKEQGFLCSADNVLFTKVKQCNFSAAQPYQLAPEQSAQDSDLSKIPE